MKSEDLTVYIIHKACGEGSCEFTMAIGYTYSKYVHDLFFELLPNEFTDECASHMSETCTESELIETLDLYDMDINYHELSMYQDQYNSNKVAIASGAVFEEIEINDLTPEIIRQAVTGLVRALKLTRYLKDKEVIQPILNKLFEYYTLYKILEDISTEDIPYQLSRLGFPPDIISKFEKEGLDLIINQPKLIETYYKTY